jgi:hypothetical protein
VVIRQHTFIRFACCIVWRHVDIYVLFVFILTPSRWYLDAETCSFLYCITQCIFGIYIERLIHFQVHLHTAQLKEITLIVRVMHKYVGRIMNNVYSEGNIKRDLQEVGGGCGDWMERAHDRDRWRALVSAVMNFRVP